MPNAKPLPHGPIFSQALFSGGKLVVEESGEDVVMRISITIVVKIISCLVAL